MTHTHALHLGQSTVDVVIETHAPAQRCSLVHLHANETQALHVGLEEVRSRGGRMAYLRHSLDRNIQFKFGDLTLNIDPNRLFSARGIHVSLCNLNPDLDDVLHAAQTVQNFADQLRPLLVPHQHTPRHPLIALHNNQGDGEYSIHTLQADPSMARVFVNPQHSPFHFFYVLDPALYDHLTQRQYSTGLQKPYGHLSLAQDDGSLSIYMAATYQSYINIEAPMGDPDPQAQALRTLIDEILLNRPQVA